MAGAISRSSDESPDAENLAASEIGGWRQRLIQRRYHFPAQGDLEGTLTARIEHAGAGHFFPLGTANLEAAAAKAQRIQEKVVECGWEAAFRQFSRELIVNFEWNANPILWTYTTIHTLLEQPPAEAATSIVNRDLRRVLVVELDPGIRRALAWCVNQQDGFCSVSCDSAEGFARAFDLHQPHLVLLNRNLAERIGVQSAGRFAAFNKTAHALSYSTSVDGDHMFVSTPGGCEGYLLKRVKPTRVFDPILDTPGRTEGLSGDLQPRIRAYFKELLHSHADRDASGLAKLTPREREVLGLLAKGCVDKEIAQALGISAWTVHGHVKNIFERLQVRTRTEAVVRYLEK